MYPAVFEVGDPSLIDAIVGRDLDVSVTTQNATLDDGDFYLRQGGGQTLKCLETLVSCFDGQEIWTLTPPSLLTQRKREGGAVRRSLQRMKINLDGCPSAESGENGGASYVPFLRPWTRRPQLAVQRLVPPVSGHP